MPRFVLLYHDCPPSYERPSHWDFLLESGDVLRTWAIEVLPHAWQAVYTRTNAIDRGCPQIAAEDRVAATQLADHRRGYLLLEGPLSGDRGTVKRVAAGTYRCELESPNEWRVVLTGEDISCRVVLMREESAADRWILTCE